MTSAHRHLIGRALAALALACAAAGLTTPGIARAATYARTGVYETMGHLPRSWKTPYQLIDGVPLVNYGTFVARNPVTAAQYGLANYSLWVRYHDRYRLRIAKHVADWLVFTQTPSGKWVYRFPETPPGSTQTLAPGWGSSLAQAQAMSLLERVYRYARKPAYLRAIDRGLAALERSVAHGGFRRHYQGRLFFEEYPTRRINFSFNGDLQTLIGVYDVDALVPHARSLFARGVATIAHDLPLFDSGHGYSYYSLASRTPPPPGYNAGIRAQLRILADVTGRSVFRVYAKRWSAP